MPTPSSTPTPAPAAPNPGILFENPAPTPAAPTPTPTPTPTPSPTPAPAAPDWKDSLPEELKASASMAKFKDIASLAKSYENLEKIVGADKLPVPPKGATLEQMKEYFEKIGMPKDPKEYNLASDPEYKVDQSFIDELTKAAHSLNMVPEQAKGLLNWFGKMNAEAYKGNKQKYDDMVSAGVKKLQTEWGEAYPLNVARAKASLREFADADTQKYILESGLGSNPHLVKMLAKVGEMLSEDKVRGEGGVGQFGALTPQQARDKIKELKGNDPQGAYWNDRHIDHAKVKKQVSDLYDQLAPDKKASRREKG